jgi:cytochrome c oxidase cbb3-type subunit 3
VATKPEIDAISGVDTTGHEWDGIKELNTPLPSWWLWVLYATIVWSIGYWIVYPAWPTFWGYTKGVIGYSQRGQVAEQLAAATAAQAGLRSRIEAASLEEITKDPELTEFAMAGGHAAFGDNCAPCHGSGAQGSKGYPNLNDDAWLWGGTLEDIYTTIQFGIRSTHEDTRVSDMPAFLRDGLLTSEQVQQVASYVLSLSGAGKAGADTEAGAALFAENCAACHGEKGTGTHELGAPNLTDAIWLYGGDRATVVETISNSRRGVMPAWTGRLDPVTIKQLAVYVHSLGGGQ